MSLSYNNSWKFCKSFYNCRNVKVSKCHFANSINNEFRHMWDWLAKITVIVQFSGNSLPTFPCRCYCMVCLFCKFLFRKFPIWSFSLEEKRSEAIEFLQCIFPMSELKIKIILCWRAFKWLEICEPLMPRNFTWPN